MAALNPEPLNARLIDALYTESMLLADEARSYFEDRALGDRAHFDPLTRVGFSCESLKVTTRLMHIIAWLLARRAVAAGEMGEGRRPGGRLGKAALSDTEAIARFPEAARHLIAASSDLYARIERLEEGQGADAAPSPARALLSRLERSI